MVREAVKKVMSKVQEELSEISGKSRSYEELISNRAIPLDLSMMKRLGYAYTGETAFHLTNVKHLSSLVNIEKSNKQISTFSKGGPELARLPSQPNCLVYLKGTEVIRGRGDIWTTVDKTGMRWIDHNVEARSAKFKLTFYIDGVLTKLLKEYGVEFNTNNQPSSVVLTAIKKVKDKQKFIKAYFKSIEKWIDSGGYKEFQKYLDGAANMKYNEVILTKFNIENIYSLDVESPIIEKFCKDHKIEYKGVFYSKELSELKI